MINNKMQFETTLHFYLKITVDIDSAKKSRVKIHDAFKNILFLLP